MTFNLVNSYFINCEEKYEEYSLTSKWEGIILVNENNSFIGSTINNNGVRELIIGEFKQDKEIELYRMFDEMQSVYLYEFANQNSKPFDTFGTFSTFAYNGLGGLGDCFLELKPYNGDYKEIVEFYQDTVSKIYETKDTLKLSIISQLLKQNISNKKSDEGKHK